MRNNNSVTNLQSKKKNEINSQQRFFNFETFQTSVELLESKKTKMFRKRNETGCPAVITSYSSVCIQLFFLIRFFIFFLQNVTFLRSISALSFIPLLYHY